ncbi:glycine betaine/proline transport system substrate-binding protein [Virgibacillus halotolerans]|uniref:glycine betaine ABC transporter substrate-binding protein n=1 Tax=Virgibacillus halotolerans TaxID=1071053 RepID=UPI00195F2650|nr:glycine betaine ABC transporter substrate-binding protein [Virgibacillus halotolerans]MBM7599286.1 glycine betaine/proline transport system substrate-binding protein [Virgibacillus halotolerans]
MKFNRGKQYILLIIISLLVLAGCGDSSSKSTDASDDKDSKEDIIMGQISWAENIAVTNMWKVILEEEGYDVEFNLLDMGTTMAALESGDLDLTLEVWLPVQDANYLKQYQDSVDFAEEPWYDNAKVGLVVPEYMEDVNSIEDLKKYQDEFEGEITGFDPGAGTMEVTEDVIEDYDLDYELITSSEPAMITEIAETIKENGSIVAPLWSPHRVFSEMDLKFLDDPKETYGGVEEIFTASRQGFDEDFAEVDQWMKNWEMDDDAIGELMQYVGDEEENPIKGAEKWVEENRDLVDEWIK